VFDEIEDKNKKIKEMQTAEKETKTMLCQLL